MKYPNYEIFSIPLGKYLDLPEEDDISILYAPLCDQIVLMDRDDAVAIHQYIQKSASITDELKEVVDDLTSYTCSSEAPVPDITKTTKMSLLPNLTCNFTCSYCYSAKGRGSTVISWDKVKTALDFFINPERIEPQHLSLFISGGGEPILSWDIIKKCIEYAVGRCSDLGFTIQISIVTNGSLLNKEMADFLLRHHCSVCVSFEVLQPLQELQRRNYEVVDRNIRMFGELGIRVMINSTVTPASVSYMQDMINTVADKYPFITQYTMEPVTSVELFDTAADLAEFYDSFYSGYLKSKQIAADRHVPLRFTYDDALRDTTVRHCPGKFCITPEGAISVCHLVSSPREKRYSDCIYGVIDGDKVKIDRERFKELYSINLFAYERCRDCYAKFSCGGECMTRNAIYPASYMDEVCRFNRRFILHQLIERLEDSVKQEYGLTLKDYVKEYQ